MPTKTKRVTIKDVARLAGVHHSTVSRIINRHPYEKYSRKVEKKIERIVARTGYRKNLRAAFFRRGKKDLGVLVCAQGIGLTHNPIYQEIVSHLFVEAGRKGDRLVYVPYPPQGDDGMENIIDESLYSGLVVFGPDESPAFLEQVAKRLPVLQMFHRKQSRHLHFILIDNDLSAKTILNYLAGRGIRRLRVIHFSEAPILMEKIIALEKNGEVHGVSVEHRCLPFNLVSKIGNMEAKRFIAGTDCILMLGSLAFYLALTRAGIRIPEQVSFMNYDNILTYRRLFPELVTVGLDYGDVAQRILHFFDSEHRPRRQELDIIIGEGQTVRGKRNK